MHASVTLRLALRGINRNRMRAGLTTLGIVIGVAAVVAMVSIGQGAAASVQAQISQLGNDILFVSAGSRQMGGFHGGAGSTTTLTPEDVEAIALECPSVSAAMPVVRASGQLVYGNENWLPSGGILGVNERFPEIREWRASSGEFFSTSDVRAATRVCVIGRTVATNLFHDADPVGRTMRIRNLPFRVVGVLAVKGQSGFGQDQDDTVLIPYTTAQKKLLSITHVPSAMVSAVRSSATYAAQTEIEALLRQRHRIGPGEEDDFSVRNMSDLAEAANASSTVLTNLLAAIAGVSLLVGGIGIMNIMLVSVTERTREIGVRMAVGARGSAIRGQFLAEAVALSLVGGLVGVLLGVAASATIASTLNWPTLISPLSIVSALVFSALVGVGFGYYPARKAAALNPIEALRYE